MWFKQRIQKEPCTVVQTKNLRRTSVVPSLVLPYKGEASDHQEPEVVADPVAVLVLGLWLLTAEPS